MLRSTACAVGQRVLRRSAKRTGGRRGDILSEETKDTVPRCQHGIRWPHPCDLCREESDEEFNRLNAAAIDDGGPAFPQHGWTIDPKTLARMRESGLGMTLRDWFAGQALAGVAASDYMDPAACAKWAYDAADEMIKRRASNCNKNA